MKKFNSVLISFCRGIIKSALHFNNHYCLAVFQRSNLVSYIHVASSQYHSHLHLKTYRCIGIALTTCYEKTCKGSEFPPNTVDSQVNGDPGSTFSYDTRPCQIIQVKETSSTHSVRLLTTFWAALLHCRWWSAQSSSGTHQVPAFLQFSPLLMLQQQSWHGLQLVVAAIL